MHGQCHDHVKNSWQEFDENRVLQFYYVVDEGEL